MADLMATWVAVFFTLGIYTFLYDENPWYRFAERVFLGTAIGYGITVNLKYLVDQWSGTWSQSGLMMIGFGLSILVGLLWYFRFSREHFYLYRIPLSIVVGTGIGLALRTVIFSQFIEQIKGQISLPLFVPGDFTTTISNIIIAITTPCVLMYFWFTGASREEAPMSYISTIARYTMMAGFGSAFGYTVLTRYSLFIGRAQFLLGIPPNPPEAMTAFMVIAAVMLITLIGADIYKRGSQT
ncbi:MAG: hypothetical protein ACLFVP_06735 [Candidatus Bathyarchaeia archaeon]